MTETAAGFFLGPLVTHVATTIEAEWRTNIADAWVKTHQRALKDQDRLDALELKVVDGHRLA